MKNVFFLTVFLLLTVLSFSQPNQIKYNVLFFSSDQHNPHFMSCDAQHPFNVFTPNMQCLADEGIVFNNAYATVTVCAPTRSSLITGCYPQKHKQYGNSNFLTEAGPKGNAPSLGHLFRDNGYNTALIGKTHSNMQTIDSYEGKKHESKELFLGFDYRIEACTKSDKKGGQKIPSLEVFREKESYFQKKYPEHLEGTREEPWEKEIFAKANIIDSKLKRYKSNSVVHPAKHKDGLMVFDAIEYLENYADKNVQSEYSINPQKPFFIYLSIVQPHWNYCSPQMQDSIDFYGMYSGREEDDDKTFYYKGKERKKIVLDDVPKELLVNDMEGFPLSYKSAFVKEIEPAATRLARARYASAVSWVDHLLGKVMHTLETLPDPNNKGKMLSETTILCYTSDHGDMMGEKNRMNKMVMFEGSSRVPFILKLPQAQYMAGSSSDLLLNHCDMFTSLAGLCGLSDKIGENVDGQDLSKFIDTKKSRNQPERTFSMNSIDKKTGVPQVVMSVSKKYKFVLFQDKDANGKNVMVLFDKIQDPFENQDLAKNEEYRDVIKEEINAIANLFKTQQIPRYDVVY